MEQGKPNITFGKAEADTVTAWWRSLEKTPGDRARLRRCHSTVEICFEPAYHRLVKALGALGSRYPDRIAIIAGVLSHVRTDTPSTSFAARLGAPKEGMKKARVSGLRFRRLIQYSDRDALYEPLIRMLGMTDYSANVADLAQSVFWWNEMTKKKWAFDYYSNIPADEMKNMKLP